ncbi:clathrin light chain B isoform X5 [Cynoglossus semilaevis]|uniref:clathrin light chain B isoform X4 n=1 Tax=Cynoglossus semilaevis TaxID=244447 RepID=UPI00049806A0|nr:clathrin light chain B-like isoform X4 [Cynoglossus semilaevis]XP_024918997.1 clathrin light chain B-like isoform X5 [Cynoglossus semilaevis]
MADNGAHPTEEDPAAAFLAQQECEIAGIENDGDGFGGLEDAEEEPAAQPPTAQPPTANYDIFGEEPATVNGDLYQESNGPTDTYAAIAQVDIQRQEPESLRKWREEQKERLEALDTASKVAEAEWREKAKKELEDWHVHQSEQMEKNKANNRASEEAFLADTDNDTPGSEWERVARLCDFNPKTNKQAKDVSRMRSVLISLKQAPLVR